MIPRLQNDFRQDRAVVHWTHKIGGDFVLTYDHAQNADGGDVVTNLAKLPARAVIDAVHYINPTGLAEHAANFAVISVKQGATVVAEWSTETGQEGTLTADTYVDLVLSATAADLIIETDEELDLSVNESGTTTVPAGRVEVYGHYVDDDATFKVFRALRKMRVDRVDLKLLAGLATSDTNYYVFELKNGSTVVADWSTKTTGGEGALTADTFHQMTDATDVADQVLDAGDTLDLDCAETGDAVLTDLEIVIHGRYL
jgi:hypothetical protein